MKSLITAAAVSIAIISASASHAESLSSSIRKDVLSAQKWDCKEDKNAGKWVCWPEKSDIWDRVKYTDKEWTGAKVFILALVLDSASTYYAIHHKGGKEVGLVASEVMGEKPTAIGIATYGAIRGIVWFTLCERWPSLRKYSMSLGIGTGAVAAWNVSQALK